MRAAVWTILLVTACAAHSGCTASDLPPVPPIVAKAIDFHGGDVYDAARIAMTITSLSGSFRIEVTREGDRFEQVVTSASGQMERRVRLTNDTVEEWRDGAAVALDPVAQRAARSYVDARVFFPLLPFTLEGGDIRFEDRGLEMWQGRELHKVKVTFDPGTSGGASDNYMFWFDPDSGRVEQFGYDFGTGLRYRKAVEFDRVGGILFSTQENYAIDGSGLTVDALSPEYVAENMDLLSTVALSEIGVEPT